MLQQGEVVIKSRAGASKWNFGGQLVVVVIVQIAIGDPPFAESNIYEAVINEFDDHDWPDQSAMLSHTASLVGNGSRQAVTSANGASSGRNMIGSVA